MIEIKHRTTGKVLFSGDYKNKREAVNAACELDVGLDYASLRELDLCGLNFTGMSMNFADLTSSDIRFAQFYCARLRGVNFASTKMSGANFRGADFKGASYGYANMDRGIVQILGMYEDVFIFDKHILIGQDIKTTSEWERDGVKNFAQKDIDAIIAMAKAHQGKM